MRRITIWSARELKVVAARDRLDGKKWHEVRFGETRARAALSRILGDATAMNAARGLLSEISPGTAMESLGDRDVVADLAWHLARRNCRAFQRANVAGGGAAAPAKRAPAPVPVAPAPEKKKEPKVLTVKWDLADAWCSDTISVSGTTKDYADGAAILVEARDRASNKVVTSVQATVSGNAFTKSWIMKDVLPERSGGKFVNRMDLDASAGGVTSPAALAAHFVPEAPRTPYAERRAHFTMSVADHVAKVEAELKFVKGWGAEVVKFGAAVPAATGGVIAGLSYAGYRWLRRTARGPQYWDGAAWTALPGGFALRDSNYFGVGIYKSGTSFVSQYGGTWPEAFSDWDLTAPQHQTKLRAWENAIVTTWSGKFELKRNGCQSVTPACCRYSVVVTAQFLEQAVFAAGMLIVAQGNGRSYDSLWYIGGRLAMAAHEFGHHLGNGDEYAGAPSLNPSLNGDGAHNGIDPDSIMGVNLGSVKRRHLGKVCSHLASMIRSASGKTYTYETVPP